MTDVIVPVLGVSGPPEKPRSLRPVLRRLRNRIEDHTFVGAAEARACHDACSWIELALVQERIPVDLILLEVRDNLRPRLIAIGESARALTKFAESLPGPDLPEAA